MAQFTVEEIIKEMSGLPDDSAAFFYLSLELSRRQSAGRPKTSNLSRAEQNRANVKKYRDAKRKEKE